jgi:hypothetical protein
VFKNEPFTYWNGKMGPEACSDKLDPGLLINGTLPPRLLHCPGRSNFSSTFRQQNEETA